MMTIHKPGIITVDRFFSPEECLEHISWTESIGYSEATIRTPKGGVMRKELRNNDRCILTDFELANKLWLRCKPHLEYFDLEVNPLALNEYFRYYRYTSGQQFKPHRDGKERIRGMVSYITLLVYLNEDFEGGETNFIQSVHRNGDRCRETLSIRPKTGSALLFLHRIVHEGSPIQSGTKYVLRTDVLYDR